MRQEYHRDARKVWLFGVAVLVPAFALLIGLLALLYALLGSSPSGLLQVPLGWLLIAMLALLALPLTIAWAVAASIARRAKPDLVIDLEGIHLQRMSCTVRWSNFQGCEVRGGARLPRLELKVKSLDEALDGVSPLLRDAMRRSHPHAVVVPCYFFRVPAEDIAQAIRHAAPAQS